MLLLGSSLATLCCCVKTKSVCWKAKQIIRLVLIVIVLSICARAASDAPRRKPRRSRSACWCSPRRRASATTRSPPAWRRSSGSPPGTPFRGYDERRGSVHHALTAALRRRDVPLDDRHADQGCANSAPLLCRTSAEAAATSASTPPPTPAATGPGTSGSSARASSATTPGSPHAPSDRRPRDRRHPRAPEPVGRARTSGTSSARRPAAHVLAAPRRVASARLVSPLRWRPLGVHRDGSYEGVLRRASLLGAPARRDRDGRRPREVRLCGLSASRARA